MRDGIPIGLGYFAVAFALGVAARSAGLHPAQGFIASLLCLASAGQYAGFSVIAAGGSYLEIAVITLVINARYLLMGIALNQKVREGTPIGPRILIGMTITDEIFGVTISKPGYVNPYFNVGVWSIALIFWSLGTALGIAVGNILPLRAVSAMSVALYGMFLASIIPPVRKDKAIGIVIAFSFAFSYLFTVFPGVSELSSGNRTILLAVVISAAAALIAPRKNEEPEIAMEGGGE